MKCWPRQQRRKSSSFFLPLPPTPSLPPADSGSSAASACQIRFYLIDAFNFETEVIKALAQTAIEAVVAWAEQQSYFTVGHADRAVDRGKFRLP